jgi:serine/threonine-protein kinase RsbT
MNLVETLRSSLLQHLSSISIDSMLRRHIADPHTSLHELSNADREYLATKLTEAARLFSVSHPRVLRGALRRALELDDADGHGEPLHSPSIQTIDVRSELDVSVARHEARRMTVAAGLQGALPIKVATVVSELARNIFLYAAPGTLTIEVRHGKQGREVHITAHDDGPGISGPRLDSIFSGTYRSKRGLGKGLLAIKRVSSEFEIETARGAGTTVRVEFRELD